MKKIPLLSSQFTVLVGFLLVLASFDSAFAITIGKAEMSAATLRLEGDGAAAGATIVVDGTPQGTSDRKGRYRFDISGFSSADCIVRVSDGVGSASRPISGCTPTAPPPPPPNLPPIANAGPDMELADSDANGAETVTLDGFLSSDPDGTVVSWQWRENAALLGAGPTLTVSLGLGVHDIELTVTDDQGATGVDTLRVSVVTPPPPPLPPLQPDFILESNQADTNSFSAPLMGASVASAGDVNGDGFEDVIVGARGWDTPGGLFDEGAAFVFLGGPSGVEGFDPSSAHAFIESTEAGSQFGSSVASAGDVNGDGFDDIIVGARLADASGLVVSGAAYVFHGGPLGITATSPADADAVLESGQIEAHFGDSVASAGDVNGDGFDDVIVGAGLFGEPFDPPIPNQGSGRQGAAFVFLGSPTGIVGTDPATAHAQLVPWAAGTPSQPGAGFGLVVAGAGDVNGDGFDDVMVGSPFWNKARPWPGLGTGDPPQEGALFLYLGGPAGITGTNATNADSRIEGNQLEAFFGGSAAAAGDVNADGFGDIIVGAPGFPAGDPLLGSQEGAAFLFLGGPAGIIASDAGGADASLQGGELAEWIGRSVGGAGDFDGDGFDDVLIGARVFAGSLNDEGVVYVFRGGPTGLVGADLTAAFARVSSNRIGGELGASVDGGDLDGDTRADLIVGVPGYTGGEPFEGAAFIYLAAGSPNPPNQPPVADAGADITVVDADHDGFGTVTLDGSGSFDADGSVVAFQWQEGAQVLGQTSILTATLPLGDHLITLMVTDDAGTSTTDSVLVRIITGAANLPPVANAGPDQSVSDDDGDGTALVTLDGTASSDPDGVIVDYIWREGATVLGTGATLQVSLAVGVHNILLQVNDNNGSGDQDPLVVTVTPGGQPAPPAGALSLQAPATANRGDQVVFTATLTNTGASPLSAVEMTLTVSPSSRIKNLSPAGAVAVAGIPAGGSTTLSWRGKADKEGAATITVQAVSAGVTIDTATAVLTILK